MPPPPARNRLPDVPRSLYRFASTTVRLLPRALVQRISARAHWPTEGS